MSSFDKLSEFQKVKSAGIGCNKHLACGSGPGYKGGTVPCTLKNPVVEKDPTLVVPAAGSGETIIVGVCIINNDNVNCPTDVAFGDITLKSVSKTLGITEEPLDYTFTSSAGILEKCSLYNEKKITYSPKGSLDFEPTELYKRIGWVRWVLVEENNELNGQVLGAQRFAEYRESYELPMIYNAETSIWENSYDDIIKDQMIYIFLRRATFNFHLVIVGEYQPTGNETTLGSLYLKHKGESEFTEVHEFTLQNKDTPVEIEYENDAEFKFEGLEESTEDEMAFNLQKWAPSAEETANGFTDSSGILKPIAIGVSTLNYHDIYIHVSGLKYTRFFVMIWIDEAQWVYNQDDDPIESEQYDTDLAEFTEVMERHKSRCALMAPTNPSTEWADWTYTIPRGYSPPFINNVRMPMLNIGRPPTSSEIISLYEDWTSSFTPSRLLLAVDVSGSMSMSTIQPAYDEFKSYLTNDGLEYEETTFGNERWLYLTTQKIIEWAT